MTNGVGARVTPSPPDWIERLPLPANRRFTRARNAVRATVDRAVTGPRASGHDTGDMLSLLLRTTNEKTGRPLTGHQIPSEILTPGRGRHRDHRRCALPAAVRTRPRAGRRGRGPRGTR
ncbi:hypothetical protein ACFUTR_26295 [Streptomyces sp. NPDC057367]|uniref:hypothetical protein n=1 Tax=Streptomyces sp. NPDC057367 TaxID=3346108 RepID=UPI0036441C20